MSARSSGIARHLRRWQLAAAAFFIIATVDAQAACTIQLAAGGPGSPASVPAGTQQSFSLVAADDGFGCSGATFSIIESADDTDDFGAGTELISSPNGTVIIGNATPINVQIAFRGGGSVTYDVICDSGCAATGSLQLQYTFEVQDRYEMFPNGSPPFVQGGETAQLRVQVRRNGSGTSLTPSEGMVCFDFPSPPANGSTLSGGTGACGNQGRLVQADGNGRAAITLNAGTPNEPLGEFVNVSATAVNIPELTPVMFELIVSDNVQVQLVSGNGQVTAPNSAFEPLVIRTTRNGVGESMQVEFLAPTNGAFYTPTPPSPVTTAADGTYTVNVTAGSALGPVNVTACIADTGCDLSSAFDLNVSLSPSLVDASVDPSPNFPGQPVPFRVRAYNGGTPLDGATIEFAPDPSCTATNVSLSATSAVTAGGGYATIDITPNTVSLGMPHCVAARWDSQNTPGDTSDDQFVVITLYTEDFYEIEAVTQPSQTVPLGSTATITVRVLRNGSPAPNSPFFVARFSQQGGPALPGLPFETTAQSAPGEYSYSFVPEIPGSYLINAVFAQGSGPKAATGALPVNLLFTVQGGSSIVAHPDDFSATPINGSSGGSTASVLANDDFNGSPPTTADVTPSITSDGGLSGVSFGSAGQLIVPPGTSPASYTIGYQICEVGSATNCASSSATVLVAALSRTLAKPPSNNGDNQSGPPGTTLALELVAVAADNGAPPASPVSVNWTVTPTGAAAITPNPSSTDSTGTTRVSATISPSASPGDTILVTATRADDGSDPETYTLSVDAAGALGLSKPATGSGDGQTGSQGQPAPQPLVVIATLDGAPQANVQIEWQLLSGDATITSVSNPTNSIGRSSAQVSFGANATGVIVEARRIDEPDAVQVFSLSATPRRTLEKPATGSGDRQTGEPGDALPLPLIVYAYDNGQPAPGVLVQWSASNGVSLSDSATSTASDGSTSISVTLGNATGDFVITAQRSDAPTATSSFVVRARTGSPAELSLDKPNGSGDGSTGLPGAQIELAALARADRRPQTDVRVLWEVLSGTATLRASSFSGADGIARNTVTLGATPGQVIVRATRADSPENFQDYTLTIQAGPNDLVLSAISGSGQSGPPQAELDPLVARLTRGTQPEVGATITWQVVSGSAQLSTDSTVTDANGSSEVGITLGSTLGPVAVRASSGTASVTYSLEVERLDPATMSLRIVSGDDQTGPVGSRAALPLVVLAQDGDDRPLRGIALEWQVISGTATLDSGQTTTGATGQSSQGLRFGSAAGPVQIRVRPVGESSPLVVFDASAFVPTLEVVSGNNQSAPAGATLPQDFVVGVAGAASGASLAGLTVRWQVTDGGGSLASSTTTTGADGRSANRLTLGPGSGPNRVTASIDGAGSVSFSANAQIEAQPLAVVSGNNQTIPTRSDSAPLTVELRSSSGAPVPGARLIWTATNAELRAAETSTDAQGRSSNVVQIPMPGDASVTVQLQGSTGAGSQVVFTLSGGVANVPQLDVEEEDVGNAIDNACPALLAAATLTPAQADLLARCLELVNNAGANPDQVELALVQMQQDVAIAQANAALLSASTQFDNVKTRMAALRGGASGVDFNGLAIANTSGVMPLSFLPSAVVQSEGDDEGGGSAEVGGDFSRWGFFASGIIGRGEQDARGATPKYDYDTTGLTAGVDYRVNDSWVVGASFGFNRQDTDVADGRGGIDTQGWSLSAYSTLYRQSNWYFDGVLTVGSNDYDIERSIQYDIVGADGATTRVDQHASASTGGDQLALALSFGRDFQKGAWTLGPYMRGNYTRVEFERYAEQLGAGAGSGLGLEVESRQLKSITGVVGGKATYAISRDWGILMPHVQVEWEHEFQDDPQALVTRFINDPTRTTIRIEGDAVDTDYYNVGFGLSALFAGGRSAFFYYERLIGSEGLTQDNLSLGVRFEF